MHPRASLLSIALISILCAATGTSCRLMSGSGPDPFQASAPTATPTPAPTLSGGAWRDPSIAPDPTHAGAYGGISYAPNGDLYLFYQTGSVPNENLQCVIRRKGTTAWSSESFVGTRLRTAQVIFDSSGKPYVASESGGSAVVSTSSNYSNATPTWAMQSYFQANDGNPSGYGANGQAFITRYGSNLNLFYTYLYYNAVFGSEHWGIQAVFQTAGSWPPDGSAGAAIDGPSRPNYATFPNGASGAFQNDQGDLLVFSNIALRSTDQGNSFTQIMKSGIASADLTGVSGAAQNPIDSSITVANLYDSGGWRTSLWKTTDHGANFSKMTALIVGGIPYRARAIAYSNLIMVIVTVDGGAGESLIKEMHSYDMGTTWTPLTTLIDATNASYGGAPGYTLGSASLAVEPSSGSIALTYSLLSGLVHKGVFMKEFY